MEKWKDNVTKNKVKPGNICRKNMVKRIETLGTNEFSQAISHNPK